MISTYRLGTPRKAGEGLRLGTVRYLPRGVRKEDYARRDYFDVWLPGLAPSRELVGRARPGEWTAAERDRFFRAYARELKGDTEKRQLLVALALLSERTDLSVGCYCEDEASCHRSVLIRLIREAGGGG